MNLQIRWGRCRCDGLASGRTLLAPFGNCLGYHPNPPLESEFPNRLDGLFNLSGEMDLLAWRFIFCFWGDLGVIGGHVRRTWRMGIPTSGRSPSECVVTAKELKLPTCNKEYEIQLFFTR